jgi:hypothetical protein
MKLKFYTDGDQITPYVGKHDTVKNIRILISKGKSTSGSLRNAVYEIEISPGKHADKEDIRSLARKFGVEAQFPGRRSRSQTIYISFPVKGRFRFETGAWTGDWGSPTNQSGYATARLASAAAKDFLRELVEKE